MSWTAFGDMAHHYQQPTLTSSSHNHHHQHHHNNHQQHGNHSHLISHSASPNMPAIQEDGVIALLDHPDKYFAKSTLSQPIRRESLLTTALHTDSESHDESSAPPGHRAFGRMTSRSSTCSTWSVHTDLTSDDGHISPGTQQHSPERSPSSSVLRKPQLCFFRNMFTSADKDDEHKDDDKTPTSAKNEDPRSPVSESSEPAVETALGRKRCISFRCGAAKDKPSDTAPKVQAKSASPVAAEPKQGPLKRLCSLRFECPTRASANALERQAPSVSKSSPRTARRPSPPPPAPAAALPQTPSPSSTRRSHRDSDSTIKNESPKSVRSKPANSRARNFTRDLYDISPSEATKFHEFASSDDDPEDWVQEQTVHRSRLTVNDTLKKENEIRNLGEQAEQEALDEDVDNDDDDDDEDDDDEDDFLSDDQVSDGGFQTDDEEGFADSDDESDDGSDYEWWASRRTRDKSPGVYTMLPVHAQRPDQRRRSSHDTSASDSSSIPPAQLPRPSRAVKKPTSPLPIRPGTPELPDSTDFVLGTLDEDRPLEAAYASCIEQRKMAKHRTVPQDIDPTFPTSDHEPDSDNDDDDEDQQAATAVEESDYNCMQGGFEDLHGAHARPAYKKTSPLRSPKRFRSPAPVKRKISPTTTATATTCKQRKPSPAPLNMKQRKPSPAPVSRRSPTPPRGRSRAPQLLFGHSPRRGRSPPPPTRLMSPPPSRRGSAINLQEPSTALGTAFLATRPQLTHTASLPRSANTFGAQLPSSRKSSRRISAFANDKAGSDDEGESTERDEPYSRGAIDIKQGLERKRLRRRQKFHEKYLKKEERKMQRGEKPKRPQPGKGAQRMRQIGIESAIYRGKRVESL